MDAILKQALQEYEVGNIEAFLHYLHRAVEYHQWRPPDKGTLRAVCRALQQTDVAKYPEANCLALAVIVHSAEARPVREAAIYYHTIRACFSVLEEKIKRCSPKAYTLLKHHFDTASRQFKSIGRGGSVLGDIIFIRRTESLAKHKLSELRRICESLTTSESDRK
ncbi:MAG: hypothetical protein ACK4ME_07635 [Fimbriimonadales bacterium]